MKCELHLLPQRVGLRAVEAGEAELAKDPLGRLVHAPIVEIDPVAADVLDGEPVAGLEVAFRRARALAEQRVVLVEALEQHLRDRARLLRAGLVANDGGNGRGERGSHGIQAIGSRGSHPDAANVSHFRMSPDSSPVLNQRSRCSAVPCVNDSGTT